VNWKRKVIILYLIATPTLTWAEGGSRETDEVQIRQIFENLTSAWKAGDGQAWGAAFLPDADFTVWFGLRIQGQEPIAQGHQFIFDRFYKDTSYELVVRKIRFLSSSAAVVHLEGTVLNEGASMPSEPDSVPLAVVQKVEGSWKIAAFQNTPFAVEKYGGNGDLRAFKGRQRPAGDR